MSGDAKQRDANSPVVPGFDPEFTTRPKKIVRDRHGRLWLCDASVDENGDLEAQGCWRCGSLIFNSIG